LDICLLPLYYPKLNILLPNTYMEVHYRKYTVISVYLQSYLQVLYLLVTLYYPKLNILFNMFNIAKFYLFRYTVQPEIRFWIIFSQLENVQTEQK